MNNDSMNTKYYIQKFFRYNILGLSTTIIIAFILMSIYSNSGKGDIIVYIYTVAIVIFELSRITGSFFYNNDNKWKENGYEPTVTFIIPAKNEEDCIAKTITKCYQVEYPKNKIEVIVINDGSTDNTLGEIKKVKEIYSDLNIISWEKNKGKKYAMAAGFNIAKGEIVVQLDSDSYLEKKDLRKLVRPFQDEKIGAVTAHTDPENKHENIITRAQTAYYFMSFRALKATESLFNVVLCCSGCCSAYRKKIILPILPAWTEERFFSIEVPWDDDRSLTNRILSSGYKTIYLSDVQAYTIVPNTLKKLIKQQVRWKKCWFVSSVNAAKFIYKTDKYVAITYFYPLIFMTILTPFIAFKTLIVNPLLYGIYPFFYIFGTFLVGSLFIVHYQFYRNDGNWKYMFLWNLLEMTILSYLLIYALINLKDIKWGTR